MPLDPKQCQPGTKGFLPQPNVYEYDGYGEGESAFDYFKEPSVTLNDDHQWVDSDGRVLPTQGTEVYATWQEAVRATIADDRELFTETIKEAQEDLEQVAKVEAWLNESEQNDNG